MHYRVLSLLLVPTMAVATPPSTPLDTAPTTDSYRTDVQQLRSDAARWNAHDAHRRLCEAGMRAVPALEEGLISNDTQQRQFAANCLRTIDDYVPSDVMLRVCVEGLRDDQEPYNQTIDGNPAYNFVFNAVYGTEYLLKYTNRAEKLIVDAQESNDGQQRFLAALILGLGGRTPTPERTSKILMVHLRDNSIHGDAILASGALRTMGVIALPYLLVRRPSAEGQELNLIDLLIAHAAGKSQSEIDELVKRVGNLGWPVSSDPTDLRADQLRCVNFYWRNVNWNDVKHD